jgi:hypothetical protein
MYMITISKMMWKNNTLYYCIYIIFAACFNYLHKKITYAGIW